MANNIPTVPLEISASDRIDVVVSAYIQPFFFEIYSSPYVNGGMNDWTRVDTGNDADAKWGIDGADLEGHGLSIAVTPAGNTAKSIYDINVEVIRVSDRGAEKLAYWVVPKGTPAGTYAGNVLLRFV